MKPGVAEKIFQTLRIAVAMCFIGHGAFGIITKAVWCNYLAVAGIDTEHAYQLMPVIGTIDILFGIIMLIYPNRLITGWLVFWGIVTALMRPLSGEPFAEFVERAGNYGAPLALLLLAGFPRKPGQWITRMQPTQLDPGNLNKQLYTCLQIAACLVFLGHGWLNLLQKKGLLAQYAHLGFNDPALVAYTAGIAEIFFALMILVKPIRELLLIFFAWKVLTETVYASYPLFEWVERGGSYGVILALYFLTPRRIFWKQKKIFQEILPT